MSIPGELKYTKTHEWAKLDADGSVLVGITHHAQDLLGDMVFVETPEPGRSVAAGEECGVVESVKAASDIYAPVAGEIVAGNDALKNAPEQVNADPYAAWLFRLRPSNPAELDALLDAAAYQQIVDAEAH